MENKALRDWANDNVYKNGKHSKGLGRVTELAKHLGISQPAVTKIIDGTVRIKFEYIESILEFTGIKAKDLLPEYYDLFLKDFDRIELNLKNKLDRLKCDAADNLRNSLNIIQDL